jgi:hypothetical protein
MDLNELMRSALFSFGSATEEAPLGILVVVISTSDINDMQVEKR